MFQNLSLRIVIELGDDNSVTTTDYSFVNIIQGYQVIALHTPTFDFPFHRSTNWIWAGIPLYFGMENAP
jgi:hypothetical protein